MDHLGERLSALVDDELGHADRDRALRHLATCETCRFEAEMLRRLKRRLHGLDAPEPSTDFMGRLFALEEPSTREPPLGPPGGRSAFGTRSPLGSSRPIGNGIPGTPGGGHSAASASAEPEPAPARQPVRRSVPPLSLLRAPWGRARSAFAGMSVIALLLGTAFIVGDEQEGAPVVRPDIEDYQFEHAVVSGQAPALDTSAKDEAGARRVLDEPAPGGARTPR